MRGAIAAALLLAAGNAWALGLGQIEVKSRRNQPLLAEIPIISTTPGELEALQARLASPETFRRVGLAPPSGVAANLKFSLGNDARGRPVIRVTTIQPVDQAVLNFLIEVDWGQGRLVREYSALVDAPNTASAPVAAAIEVPVTPDASVVQRPVQAPAPVSPVDAAEPPPAAEPIARSNAIAPAPARAPEPASTAPVAAASSAAEYGPVKAGETLSAIASGLPIRQSFSLDQTMLALMRANPDAFLGDDMNRLKQGMVLRVPGREDVAAIDATEASQVVRQQMRQWRQARRTVRQPAAIASSGRVATRPAQPQPAAPENAVAAAKPVAAATPAVTPRREEARLQIVPPSAPGKANETRSGTAAGGEGSMLQQQLRQKDEDIAAKSAEIGELKERVAELEKLKEEQQKLLTLKDTELATAQQRLATANNAPAAPPAATTQANTAPSTQDSAPEASNAPYIWGGLGVIALALLAWLLGGRRRKRGKAAPPRKVFDSEALAASKVPSTASKPVSASEDSVAPGVRAAAAPAAHAVEPAAEPQTPAAANGSIDVASLPPTPPSLETPQWPSGWVKSEAAADADGDTTLAADMPTPSFITDAEMPTPKPPVVPKASAAQRFKLARAFLDIGDDHSARQLLVELLDDADPAARTEANRMLRDLG